MKRMAMILSVLFCMALATGCGPSSDEPSKPTDHDTKSYDLERYMAPLWSGNIVYNETVLPLSDRFGEAQEIQLLYDATEIISVRNGTLDTKMPESSYELRDGKLLVKKQSGMLMRYEDYYLDKPNFDLIHLPSISKKGKYLVYQEGNFFHNRQLAVTYRHSGETELTAPEKKGDLLPKTMKKLKEGENFNLVLYGDSISVGANASDYFEVNANPHTPIWGKMLCDALEARSDCEIAFDNSLSKGGEYGCTYGVNPGNLEKLNAMEPDLLIIGFGMNDKDHYTKEKFAEAIRTIMESVSSANPDCEFILVSSWLANPDITISPAGNDRIREYREEMLKMETTGVAVADVTSMHEQWLQRKRFMDMTGNNVNHPNDFTTRMYAQVVNECLKD